MQEILRNNTGTTLHSSVQQSLGFAPKANFIGALQGFNKLAPEDLSSRFGSDAPAARAFLQRQTQFKIGKMIVKGQRWQQSATLSVSIRAWSAWR